jgi:hypothetical protein
VTFGLVGIHLVVGTVSAAALRAFADAAASPVAGARAPPALFTGVQGGLQVSSGL